MRGLVLVIRMDARATGRRASSTTGSSGPRPRAPGCRVPPPRRRRGRLRVHGRSISFSIPGMSARRCSPACSTRRARPRPSRAAAAADARRCARRARQAGIAPGRPQFEACSTCCWGSGAAATMQRARSSSRRRAAPDASPRRCSDVPGIARRVPEPAGRALSRDAARRREFGDGPARPRPRPHAPPAGRPRAAGRAALRALYRRAGRARLAGREPVAGRGAGGGRRALLALDFDAFLADVPGQFRWCSRISGCRATMPRSRRSPEAPCCASTRRHPSRRSRRERAARLAGTARARGEIAKGLAWLDKLARADAAVAAVLARGARERRRRRGPRARPEQSGRLADAESAYRQLIGEAPQTPSPASTSPASCGVADGSRRRSKSTSRRSTSASRSPRKCSPTWP